MGDTVSGRSNGVRMKGERCQPRQTSLSGLLANRDTHGVTLTEKQSENTRNRQPGAFAKENGKKKLRQIVRRDLEDTGRLLDLYADSVRRGLAFESEPDRLSFVAAAEHALRKGVSPCKLFASTANNRNWHHASQADEDAANRRLKLHLHGESAPPPRETPGHLDLAWQGSA